MPRISVSGLANLRRQTNLIATRSSTRGRTTANAKTISRGQFPGLGDSRQVASIICVGSAHLSTWISAEAKRRFGIVAESQGLSASAFLKGLAEQVLAASGGDEAPPSIPIQIRDARVTIRLGLPTGFNRCHDAFSGHEDHVSFSLANAKLAQMPTNPEETAQSEKPIKKGYFERYFPIGGCQSLR